MRLLPTSLLLLSAVAAQAAVLIQIDVSDPTNVTFTATGTFSGTDNSTYTTDDGVDLMAFFTGGAELDGAAQAVIPKPVEAIRGNFTASGALAAYNDWVRDNDINELGLDLNLYESPSGSGLNASVPGVLAANLVGSLQTFSTTSAAFTGASTIDFTKEAQFLPQVGATGEIRPGYGANLGASIGQWIIIPEPSTYAILLGAGVLAAATIARRRRT